MNRNIQRTASLVLLFAGALIATFSITRYWTWSECDERYMALIHDINQDGYWREYYEGHGQHDYYIKHILNFRPSGRMYSGSNDSALQIVGGTAIAIFGLAGAIDTFRRNRGSKTPN